MINYTLLHRIVQARAYLCDTELQQARRNQLIRTSATCRTVWAK